MNGKNVSIEAIKMFKKVPVGTTSRLTFVDHNETYGRHIIDKVTKNLSLTTCLDIGCGTGNDLITVGRNNPNARLFGVDYGDWNKEILTKNQIEPISVNIESDSLPFSDASIDMIISNQVLEHTKEIYWINHEIFRVLKVGGLFYLGVPNVLALHNRLLGLLGVHPTCSKIISAHVRSFSKNDTLLFYKEIGGDFTDFDSFYGSQFYPFGKNVARFLSYIFPSLSLSIFFVFRKTGAYDGQFINHLENNMLETNFFKGQSI